MHERYYNTWHGARQEIERHNMQPNLGFDKEDVTVVRVTFNCLMFDNIPLIIAAVALKLS